MDKGDWMEVRLTVDGEMAEAVAEVLARYAINGVVVESDVCYTDAEDEGTPYGPMRVYAYLPLDEHVDDTRHRIEEALWHLSSIQPLPDPEFHIVRNQNWMEVWKQHYHPIPIGERLMVLPAWFELESERRIPVRIDPSMAFGTGTHPTTQLCLAMVERYIHPGQPVIDLGCGSGILSIAAIKLGSSKALAVDIDPESVKAARENAVINAVEAHIEVGQGSVAEVAQGKFTIRRAPLVLVNILAPVILRLFHAGLPDLVSHGGLLVLSGILAEQEQGVLAESAWRGFSLVDRDQLKDWVVLVLKK